MPKELIKLHFGTAGIPLSTPKKSTINGIKRVKELGLDAMEIEFVRGIRMSEAKAAEAKEVAQSLGVVLTVHAPYYINLNSDDEAKRRASIERIIESARIGYKAGAWSVVFHPGYYGDKPSQVAYLRVKEALLHIVKVLNDEGIDIWIRPETMGALSEIGSLEEVIRLAEEIGEKVLPCIDFAHLHARSIGRYNSYEEFRQVLETIEQRLGKEALKNMHIHVSGIEYGPRGEVRHLNLPETQFRYRELMRVLKEFEVRGVVISESPNLEEDALLMKKAYHEV